MKMRLGVTILGLLGATGCAGVGTLKSQIYLPVTEAEKPAVSNEQICQLVQLEFNVMKDNKRQVMLAPVKVGGNYDAQSHSCSFQGQWAVGSYIVRAYYPLEYTPEGAAAPQASWTPQKRSEFDKIQAEHNVTLVKDTTTTQDFRLSRGETMTKPEIKLPENTP